MDMTFMFFVGVVGVMSVVAVGMALSEMLDAIWVMLRRRKYAKRRAQRRAQRIARRQQYRLYRSSRFDKSMRRSKK